MTETGNGKLETERDVASRFPFPASEF